DRFGSKLERAVEEQEELESEAVVELQELPGFSADAAWPHRSPAVSDLIDQVGFRVSDLSASRRMYEAALGELGFSVLGEGEFEGDSYVLFGRGENDDFALHAVGSKPGRDRATTGAHVAFIAPDEGSVERWHGAAVCEGGTDNGSPALETQARGRHFAALLTD